MLLSQIAAQTSLQHCVEEMTKLCLPNSSRLHTYSVVFGFDCADIMLFVPGLHSLLNPQTLSVVLLGEIAKKILHNIIGPETFACDFATSSICPEAAKCWVNKHEALQGEQVQRTKNWQ